MILAIISSINLTKRDLRQARRVAEDWRTWFLEQAEKYSDSFGVYSTDEHEELKFHMRDPIYCYDYAYVAIHLETELDHAVRNLLKSKGIAPMRFGLGRSVRTGVREGILSEEHQEQYDDLRTLAKEVRRGRIENRASDRFDEVMWRASEDATYKNIDDARDAVYGAMELLDHIYNLQSPFIDSRR